MAADQSKKDSEEKEQATPTPQPEAQTRIVWDDSNMRSAYANVFHVSGVREEFVLLFGMNQAWSAGQKEVKVQLSDRIVLSPFAAKRLSLLLNNVIKNYESKHGSLDVETGRPDSATIQ